MTTGELKFQTPWKNLQGYECQITSNDWKHYSFHVGNPHNISVGGFTSTVAANIAMRDRIMVLKALSSTEQEANNQPDNLIEIEKRGKKRGKKSGTVEPVEPVEEKPKRRRAKKEVTDVATVTPIEPKQPTYSFTAEEDAALVPTTAGAAEDW